MFGRRWKAIDATINKLLERVSILECKIAVLERLRSKTHCKCGRYVAQNQWRWIFYNWDWYDRGNEPALESVLCPDCLTRCGPGDKTEQLQREGKAK